MSDLNRKDWSRGWMVVAAVATFVFCSGINMQSDAATCSSNQTQVTLVNDNSFSIYLGEQVKQGFPILRPSLPPNDWKIAPSDSITMCVPPAWTSGVFWARTGCNFTDLYQSDDQTEPFTACSIDADCSSLATSTGLSYDCIGGACMVDCSSQSDRTNDYCNGEIGPSDNTQAICSNGNTGSAAKYVCTYPTGVVCKTGDCAGLYQCQGKWDGNEVKSSPNTPASLFEITTTAKNGETPRAANYDVSNVSGYNDPIYVSVDFTPSSKYNNSTCTPVGCESDLNATCPTLLQIIEPPTSTTSSIPCGAGEYCEAGACIACPADGGSSCVGGFTCDIGCEGPGSVCGNSYPSPVAAPGANDLDCADTIPAPTASPIWTPDNSEYIDMYLSENHSGSETASDVGTAMFSGNQGTPTCWGDIDCAPGEECLLNGTSGIDGLPNDVGICAIIPSPTSSPTPLPISIQVADCSSASDETKGCGGYPNSGVYTCVAAAGVSSKVACVPDLDPITVGLGTFNASSTLFTGIAAPLNPEWNAAALWAAGDGTNAGTTPYYETFSNACPHQYAWTYDDHTGGLACNGAGQNHQQVAFTVAFGALYTPTPSATPTVTPSTTPSSTPTASPSASPTATPTASPTASSTPTPTATATPSTTPTATPSATPTSTPTATSSATPTSTATATPGPICSPSIYLSTDPSGTLAFGDVAAGDSVEKVLTVTNNEPSGVLQLTKGIQGNAQGFSVTGGSCVSDPSLGAGDTCNYNVTLHGRHRKEGAVSTQLLIVGRFEHHACPAGDTQRVSVTLAGEVTQAINHF